MASDFPTARVSLWVPPASAEAEGCWAAGKCPGPAGRASLWPRSHRHAAGKCPGPEDLQHSLRGWGELGETQTSQGNLLPTLRPLPRALGPLYQRLSCRSQTLDGCVELTDPDLTHPGGQLGAASDHNRLCSQSGTGARLLPHGLGDVLLSGSSGV